ncbi:MAG: glycoside hydrolase family 44 protein [Thermodesulfovibrionales bacterium]
MMKWREKVVPVFLLLLGIAIGCTGEAFADQVIYSDSLAAGWDNWSWSAAINLANATPAHGEPGSIAVTVSSTWGALYLHSATGINVSGYDALSFWIHGGVSGGQQLEVKANGGDGYRVTAQANTWTQVNIPLSALGSPAVLSALYWQDATGGTQPVFYLDDIILVARTGPPPPPVSGPALSINVGANHHPISDDIYGMNFAEEQLAAELRLPVNRWGGNSTTRYNWQTSMTNTGNDWYFENLLSGTPDPIRALPNGSDSDQFIEQNVSTGTRSLITVPLIGWTAKAGSPANHPFACGFKVSKYGQQQSTDYWDPDCGNGKQTNGALISGNDPTDTSNAINTGFVTGWIGHLKNNYGTAADGGVTYYALDNEPMLWSSTHRDVHQVPTTYDELRDKTYLYAPAIKDADPSAKVMGPVLWGWCAYITSAADQCDPGGPDITAHGNTWFVPWYLQQMKTYEQQYGKRVLDYLDLHYYPQADGVSLSDAGGAATQALRLRSTKDLWDPEYTAESWISDKVHLIPRMRDWVSTNYPNTKLAITEYNWGGLEHINGALAQADVLGIFGREGLDLATLWGPPTSSQPGAFAFRIYRNYDGARHGFGNVSITAASADQDKLSVYAAQRSSDNAVTVIVINKSSYDMNSSLSLAGFSPFPWAGVYQYSSANLGAITKMMDQAVTAGGFSALFPANSITLFIMFPACTGDVLRINGSPSSITSIQEAYLSVSGTDTIQVTAGQQNSVDFNLEKNIILKGGYNCAFDEPPSFYTTISDKMTITTGSVVVDRIIIM